MSVIKQICISDKRGTEKYPVEEAILRVDWGIVDDAHAGNWHRQVSLLSYEKIEEFNSLGGSVKPGAFGENIIIDQIDLSKLAVGTRFCIGHAMLELTQIGKECHTHCAIYHRVGHCIMPSEGVFTKVIKAGLIKVGDEVEVIAPDPARPFTAAVITLSDKGFLGQREDKSGPLAARILKEAGYEIVEKLLLPDDQPAIEKNLIRLSDQRQINLIVTTGGTGFSPRDCTPEATMNVATRNAPGIAEAIRAGSMQITRRAMLSREASVIRNQTLIINLPGSPKAVKESLSFVIDQLDHGLKILTGRDGECGRA